MNRKLLIILVWMLVNLASLPTWAQQAPANVRYMSLQECLDYAYKHNEDIIVANLEIEKSQAKVGEYLSQGLPQIDAKASVNKNFILRRTFLPADQFNPAAPADSVIELKFGLPYDGDIGLNISQMIFNGSYFVGLKASKALKELSRKDQIKTKTDVTELVTKAYYTVLVSEISHELILANYNRLDSLLRETRIMYENGVAEKIDVNRTTVEFNNIKTQLTKSTRAIEINLEILKFQMGMPAYEKIEITESLSDIVFDANKDLGIGLDIQNRIELAQLESQEELATYDMKNNQVQYIPNMDLYLSWGLNGAAKQFNTLGELGNRHVWPDYQLAGIKLYIPIFDGLMKSKKIQQTKLKIQQISYQRMKLENSINLEVRQTRYNLLNQIEQLENQKENMKLAREVYEDTKMKYQEGVGSNLEVIEADNAYKTAQNNYFTALYEALIAKVDYEKALGILLDSSKQK